MLVTLCCVSGAPAQNSELYIYGFNQTILNNKDIEATLYPNEENQLGVTDPIVNKFKTNSFALHQLNLFFQKPITERTTFFLNLEATGSYSSKTPSGTFAIQEGWISHRFDDLLNVKVGLMLPIFNNLNEIRNRLPLFPYLIRPIVYEDLFNGLFNVEDLLPQTGFVQINGYGNLTNDLLFDYAFHISNSEPSYASNQLPGEGTGTNQENATFWLGENLTTKLAYGARIGIKDYYDTFKFGISGTYDHDNRNQPTRESVSRLPIQVLPVLGDVPRYRLGSDFSLHLYSFDLEMEFIGVFHDHSDFSQIPAYRNLNLNKFFYYFNLNYNFNPHHFSYVGFNRMTDHSYDFLLNEAPDGKGLNTTTVGYGYKPIDDIVFKAQVNHTTIGENPHIDILQVLFTFGVSVIF